VKSIGSREKEGFPIAEEGMVKNIEKGEENEKERRKPNKK